MSDKQTVPQNQSIHPRVVKGRTAFPKHNTARPRRTRLSDAKLARMQEHMTAHPNDSMTAARLAKGRSS